MTAKLARKNQLYVIPYKTPFYELLLSGKLTIQTATGKFAVKTGAEPRKYRGWVGFYNSTRVAHGVAERHRLDPKQPHGVLVGLGFLDDSRWLNEKEKYWLTLGFNNLTQEDFSKICRDMLSIKNPDRIPLEERYDYLSQLWPDPPVLVIPMWAGHFYRPESLKRFVRPIPINYPSGPILGTHIPVTPKIRKALAEVGVKL